MTEYVPHASTWSLAASEAVCLVGEHTYTRGADEIVPASSCVANMLPVVCSRETVTLGVALKETG